MFLTNPFPPHHQQMVSQNIGFQNGVIKVTLLNGVLHQIPTLWFLIIPLVYPLEWIIMAFPSQIYWKINHQLPNPLALSTFKNWIWTLYLTFLKRCFIGPPIIQIPKMHNIIVFSKIYPTHLVLFMLLKCYRVVLPNEKPFYLPLVGLIPQNKISCPLM